MKAKHRPFVAFKAKTIYTNVNGLVPNRFGPGKTFNSCNHQDTAKVGKSVHKAHYDRSQKRCPLAVKCRSQTASKIV